VSYRKVAFILALITFAICHCSNDEPKKKVSAKMSVQSKKQLSQEKLQTVTSLSAQLEKKKVRLTATKQSFDATIQSTANELAVESNKSNLQSFEQSMRNKKIANHLRLIQKATAYKELVENEIQLTENNLLELDSTAKLVQLDIIMLDGMAEERLDELLSKLDLTIKDITPQAEDLVLHDEPNNKRPLQELYDEYIVKVRKQKEIDAQIELQNKQKEEKFRAEQAKIELQKKQEEERRNAILEPDYSLPIKVNNYKKIVWCPTKNLLAILSDSLMVWDFVNKSLLTIPLQAKDAVWIPDSDGERMLILTSTNTLPNFTCLKHWSIKTNKELETFETSDLHHAREFLGWSGGNVAISTGYFDRVDFDKSVIIWNETQKQPPQSVQAENFVWKDESSFFYTDKTTVYLYDLTTASIVASQNQCINESENIASTRCPRLMEILWNRTSGLLAINARYWKSIQPETNTITFWDTKKQQMLSDSQIFFALSWLSGTATLLGSRGNNLITLKSGNAQQFETGFTLDRCDSIRCSPTKACCSISNSTGSDSVHIICQARGASMETVTRLKNNTFFDATWSFSGRRLAARSMDGVDIWDLSKYLP
jgi:hypothetical protein